MINFDDAIHFKDKKNDVITIGELLIDMISADYGDNFACDTYNKFFGGSPANIVMNLNKLGVNSIVASAVGRDGLGDFLINTLKKHGLSANCIQQVDASTSMVLVTRSKETPIPIFYRAADYNLTFTKELEDALINSKLVHFSCWPISKMPVRETIEKVIDIAAKNEILICFDPNYHPMIWEKGEAGVEYVKYIISKADIVKPSEDDAERLFGKGSPLEQIEKFLNLGVKLVIMTLGKEGAIVSNGKETITLKTMATKVVDATGAGDAFYSGFYAAIIKGYTIREALNYGQAVSAYKLKYVGAVVDLPKLENIKDIYGL